MSGSILINPPQSHCRLVRWIFASWLALLLLQAQAQAALEVVPDWGGLEFHRLDASYAIFPHLPPIATIQDCSLCHSGSNEKSVSGQKVKALAAHGNLKMSCLNCHGDLSKTRSDSSPAWITEPKCQSCHTGTATSNNGQLRYTSGFDAQGRERIASDDTFATTPDTPAAGLSLYRSSIGHGNLPCSACHGSAHAEFAATNTKDQNRYLQHRGPSGTLTECDACHKSTPYTFDGGPHGMHPVGQKWLASHQDGTSKLGKASCQACHGADLRGTVLSMVQAERSLVVENVGVVNLFRGALVGCYTCHRGPANSGRNPTPPPVTSNVSAQTRAGVPVELTLPAQAPGVNLHLINHPENGSLTLSNGVAIYIPWDGFTGTDYFTYSAYDGAKNSQLATGTVTVVTVKTR